VICFILFELELRTISLIDSHLFNYATLKTLQYTTCDIGNVAAKSTRTVGKGEQNYWVLNAAHHNTKTWGGFK